MPEVTTYGSWKSPITPELIVTSGIALGQIALDGDDIYWIEGRPQEGGRNVIVRWTPDGATMDLTPPPFNVRTRVHEYGGGAFAVADGVVYFSNFSDQRMYCQEPGEGPQPITPEGDLRYADGVVDREGSLMYCVREDHTVSGREPVNTLVSLPLHAEGTTKTLAEGYDFYSSPRLSPDGSRLAWLSWNHPNMPWDGTELWVASLEPDRALGRRTLVAGGPQESIFQPEWSPSGELYFVSDRGGWWNIYHWRDAHVVPVNLKPAEFGKPMWMLGATAYGFATQTQIICSYAQQGRWSLAALDTESGNLEPLEIPYSEMGRGDMKVSPDKVVFEAGSPTSPVTLLELSLTTGHINVLRKSSDLDVDEGYLSLPDSLEFPTGDGQSAFGFHYAPRNQDHVGPPEEKPPLLVKTHGGPTGAASSNLALEIQYWTSRGIAVLDVNYRGSTGYGRGYRELLKGRWGIVDLDDAVNGALYLAEKGLVDSNRLAIDGGSAGGYTTLAAITFRDVFSAGASYYGISDLEALALDTHKFESRYLDGLVGPYPEEKELYVQRSPLHHTHLLACPLILFQGLEDKIVPPDQAERMFQAVKAKGLPTSYLAFEGEQHGFRRAETIKRCLEAELYFYSRVFGFELAYPVEEIPIQNL